MPAFQRQFVWSMSQIEKLWDSILLDYPIATFLFWHVDDSNVSWDTFFCNFRSRVTFDSKKQADGADYELMSINTKFTDTAVLDGQQRLTSLLVSLYGETSIRPNYARKKTGNIIMTKLLIELNKHKIDVDEEEYNSKLILLREHKRELGVQRKTHEPVTLLLQNLFFIKRIEFDKNDKNDYNDN